MDTLALSRLPELAVPPVGKLQTTARRVGLQASLRRVPACRLVYDSFNIEQMLMHNYRVFV